MNAILALLAVVGTLIAVVAMLIWRRRPRPNRHPADAPDSDSTGTPESDWQQVAQRTHHSQIEALREWMGEDHELVQQLRSSDAESAHDPHPTPGQRDERLV